MKMIPLFKPSIGRQEINAVNKILKSGWLGLGPKTAEFEERFADFVGARFAVGMNSCTAALHLALNVLGIRKGDEVIVPPITFVSTAHAVLYNQAKPVFADVEPDTLCIDINDIKRKITSKTRAIIPVHYAGHPVDLDEINYIAKKKNIEVIEDAAHACGAEYKGRRIGSISRLTCFSFHAVKNLTCGEGGMITTDDENLYRRLKELRWLGISKDTWTRTALSRVYAWQYWVNDLGFKAHLNDVASAIGLVQLSRLPGLNRRRRQIVARYNQGFKGIKHILLPVERDYVKSSWHIYHVKIKKRDELIAFLKNNGIAPGVHYFPIHLHPYYRKYNYSCPVAESVWKQIISLPIYPDLKDAEVDKIIDTVQRFVKKTNWKETQIIGRKTTLRNVQGYDLGMILKWRNENRMHFFDSSIVTKEMQDIWFDKYLKGSEADRMYIIQTKDNIPIGMLGLKDINHKNKQAEFGRLIIGNRHYRGKGFAIDATRALLNFAFCGLKINKIYLRVFKKNIKAKKLYERCGFVEDKLKQMIINGKRFKNVVQMSILKDNYK